MASSGSAYGIRTGRDENGDLIFNDRPGGVGRNTLRASAQWTINMYVGYTFAFGRRSALPPGVTVIGGGGTAAVRTFDQGGARYRLTIGGSVQNLTNRPNYIGYSGTMTSDAFPPVHRRRRHAEGGAWHLSQLLAARSRCTDIGRSRGRPSPMFCSRSAYPHAHGWRSTARSAEHG